MQLNDFLLSTCNLDDDLTMFVSIDKKIKPITELKYQQQHLILMSTNKPTLKLNQFRARVSQLNLTDAIYFASTSYPLFGYRLQSNQIILS